MMSRETISLKDVTASYDEFIAMVEGTFGQIWKLCCSERIHHHEPACVCEQTIASLEVTVAIRT